MSGDRDLLAAEYVLGSLPPVEREEATRLRGSDAGFDRDVVRWERRLSGLNTAFAPVAPPESVWERIAARLGSAPAEGADGFANVVVLRRALARWRLAAGAASALAAGLALFALDRDLLRPAAKPLSGGSYVAAVNRGGDLPALIVRVDLGAHAVTVRPVQAAPPPGKSLELWFVASGQAPKSMGIIGQDRASMPMPADMPMEGGAFAVSVEPTGGSPTGTPTGPVVYQGKLIAE